MKKLLALLLCLAMVFTFAACGGGSSEGEGGSEPAAVSFDDIDDNCESADGTYQIAMVTDVGQLKDGSFNQFTWNGVKMYAYENDKTYKYYQPANGSAATDDDRIKAMTDACEAGAEVIVTPGFLQATALEAVCPKYPEVQFIFIDGWDMGAPNLLGVSYQEEQAGYLAGYAAVMEGYTKLGFSGGGGGSNPACIRYGYGYAQGANAAAEAKGIDVEMRYSWEYGSSFSASDDLQAMLAGWFNAGTEVCFMCGGTMFNSGAAAAEAADAAIIGVDVDQSNQSDAVVTSAMKGLAQSVIVSLGNFYSNGLQSGSLVLGAADDAVGLPVDTWSLQNWTVDEYNELFEKIKSGEIVVDNNSDMADPSKAGLEHVTFVK
ncbi:MAG: BMP family ABC transporter substrate-binding protein [Firmicutes bacterium]|nr:BMP family ABC transporter substrate-binding protein [Clostridiales bacterium]MBQ6088490.1 BMP family ABC transporter substrate-binding protein [Bacillota bacterium]MBQ6607785.1 BMP family ABC transporter substrate-binding protein [Bacillota bacterium]MBR3259953.1 BMP family ABC transporter substrate-binding protein [Bacillota bacterium]MBR6225269.1 BMP family ABC transporter substrate-binding protein [Bacillota bacterium]